MIENKKQAFDVIIGAINAAFKSGVYDINESKTIHNALDLLSIEVNSVPEIVPNALEPKKKEGK